MIENWIDILISKTSNRLLDLEVDIKSSDLNISAIRNQLVDLVGIVGDLLSIIYNEKGN